MTARTVTRRPARSGPGRPRGFDEGEALAAALDVFWRQGYEATSLEDLTAATGLSRSSLYGCFGSKREVLLAALADYSEESLARLEEIAARHAGAGDKVRAIIEALVDPQGGPRGCLMVNCITELAPHDPDVRRYGRRHIEGIEGLVAALIAAADDPADPSGAADRATALVSLAVGAITLRKAGVPRARIDAVLRQAEALMPR